MSKTLIDVDDEALAYAQSALRTTTKRETINCALREVAALHARRQELQRLSGPEGQRLLDPDLMLPAWQ